MSSATSLLPALFCLAAGTAQAQSLPDATGPELLTFEELKTLSNRAYPPPVLASRLDRLLKTPFVGRDSLVGQSPHRPEVASLGPSVRVAFWNIERGMNFDLIRAALTNARTFKQDAGERYAVAVKREAEVQEQLQILQQSDVVVLNEVDWGMKRSGYRDVAGDLASALGMNYTFGVEFVELDRLFDLDVAQVDLSKPSLTGRLQQDLQVDPTRYRGLHGNAILSRYAILRARIVRLPVCYDWYGKETEAISLLESGKRWSAHKLFQERIGREVRRGGRMALIAEVAIPGLPMPTTVVAVHLENKCPPRCRRQQMQALLNNIGETEGRVILAGDLNTTGSDATPTSLRNEIMKRVVDYRFWITQSLSWFTPISIPQYLAMPLRYFSGYLDPTARHLPLIWHNPERRLFRQAEKFRFRDGYSFDFRGERRRSWKEKGRTLANSNQRAWKGFVPSYAFERDYGGLVGRYKLDWIFVKAFTRQPRGEGQPYRFAPHFGVTMRELNGAVKGRIADHAPMTVDLPIGEPELKGHGN